MKFSNILLIFVLASEASAFVPVSILSSSILLFDQYLGKNYGQVSESITHEEITRRGIIQSAVRYFYDQPGGKERVNLSKIDNEYRSLERLYYDYYGKSICFSDLSQNLLLTFVPNVARVDFESSTKELPYAHFDAETFVKSNELVINKTNQINALIDAAKYEEARSIAGQVLHTIQDFYSHSNHVEMGITTINKLIGTPQFQTNQQFIGPNEENACIENCQLVTEPCTLFVSIFSSILANIFGVRPAIASCPLTYYNCSNNINILDKLLSGYYGGQTLEDNTPVVKPDGLTKCSHGGVLDSSSVVSAKGGINKDSGFLVFSPHAYLHTKAALLGVEHTEYFFNQIRARIGDVKYDAFMHLKVNNGTLRDAPSAYVCSSYKFRINFILLGFLIFLTSFVNY